MMRRTGKLYLLTMASAGLPVLSSLLIVFWNGNTSQFHLWADIIPQGFGIASLITSTLIVSTAGAPVPSARLLTGANSSQAMITSVTKEDMPVATGS